MPDVAQTDDASVEDGDELWRRIHPTQVLYDKNLGKWRPTSNAFRDSSSGHSLSVYLARLVLSSGRTAESIIESWPQYSLASLTAGVVRADGLAVRLELDPAHPEEEAHAVIVGKKSRPVSQRLAAASTWVVPPTVEST